MKTILDIVLTEPTSHKGLERLALVVACLSGLCRDQQGFDRLKPEARHGCRGMALAYMHALAHEAPLVPLAIEPDAIRTWLTPDARVLYPDES